MRVVLLEKDMNSIKSLFDQYKRTCLLKLLTRSAPEDIEAYGRKLILPAFQRAARKLPAYRKFLSRHGLSRDAVKTLTDFQTHVPVLTKEDIFPSYPIQELLQEGQLKFLANVTVSSGFSRESSFGFGTFTDRGQTAFMIDTLLEYLFHVSRKRTFLLNCLPMGVKIPSSLPMAETSVCSDLAISILQKLQTAFEQFLIVGDPYFLKKLVEDGCTAGLDWPKINASLILGSDWFSDSYRHYMAQLLGVDFNQPDQGYIGANFGVTELDLSLAHETIETIRLREELQRNPDFRQKILGGPSGRACPELLVYYPNRSFLETTPQHELLFTMLNPKILTPLIRYNTRDTGRLIPHNTLQEILTQEGRRDLLPELKLPLLALQGRANKHINLGGKTVSPEDIKEGLYSDLEVAGLTTGYFRISGQGDSGQIEIQLKEHIPLTPDLRQKFRKALLKFTNTDMEIVIYHYHDFPYGMSLNYERKFVYI